MPKTQKKKIARPKKTQRTPSKKYINETGQLCLTREHLLEIELLRVKRSEKVLIAQARHAQAEKLHLNSVLQVKALRHEALAAERGANEFKDEQKLLFNRLGPVYGIDFRKVTYDDETGIITVLEESSSAEEGAKSPQPNE